jgi:1-acyl-sn-glycerol-3-phosphate acyltransferase
MKLFNAGSFFNEENQIEFLKDIDNVDKLKTKLSMAKRKLLKDYKFETYGLPDDFTQSSYIIAANHLTDCDAPLILSYYYEIMNEIIDSYPQLFIFAKENCFNGVSISKELLPILELEKVVAVDRNKVSGSLTAIKTAKSWVAEANGKPRHFLIFPQGTTYDVNLEKIENIERGTFWLSSILQVPILPAFIEQAVEGEINRLVFGKPIAVPKGCKEFDEYKTAWIKEVIEAENSLASLTGIPAREAMLDEDHKIRKKFNNMQEDK